MSTVVSEKNIKIVKLTTGEELLGEVTQSMNGDFIIIKNPVVMGMVSQNQIGFMNYMPYAEFPEGIRIESKNIMFQVGVEQTIKDNFIRSQSKIITPPTPSIKLAT